MDIARDHLVQVSSQITDRTQRGGAEEGGAREHKIYFLGRLNSGERLVRLFPEPDGR